MWPSTSRHMALYSGTCSKTFCRLGIYLSIYSSRGMMTPCLPYFSRSASPKPALNTKSGRVLALDISSLMVSPHWSAWMVFHSTWTLVCSSRRLKMVRLLGSDSVLAGKLVRPVMVAFSFRGMATSAGSTSRPRLSPRPALRSPQPASRDSIVARARARERALR